MRTTHIFRSMVAVPAAVSLLLLLAACSNPVSKSNSTVNAVADYLYVANSGSTGANGLCAHAIGSDGTLSPITLSSAGSTTGSNPAGIAISPNGSYLYVTNVGSNSGVNGLCAYAIGSDGTLSPITLSSAGSTTGSMPGDVVIGTN